MLLNSAGKYGCGIEIVVRPWFPWNSIYQIRQLEKRIYGPLYIELRSHIRQLGKLSIPDLDTVLMSSFHSSIAVQFHSSTLRQMKGNLLDPTRKKHSC